MAYTCFEVESEGSIAHLLKERSSNTPVEEVLASLDATTTLIASTPSGKELATKWAASLSPKFYLVVNEKNKVCVAHTLAVSEAVDHAQRVVALFNDRGRVIPPPLFRTSGTAAQQGTSFDLVSDVQAPSVLQITTKLAADSTLEWMAHDPSDPVTTLCTFPLPEKWAWVFLTKAPMNPRDAFAMGAALQGSVDQAEQPQVKPLMDWLRVAITPLANGGSDSSLKRSWKEITHETVEIQAWLELPYIRII